MMTCGEGLNGTSVSGVKHECVLCRVTESLSSDATWEVVRAEKYDYGDRVVNRQGMKSVIS